MPGRPGRGTSTRRLVTALNHQAPAAAPALRPAGLTALYAGDSLPTTFSASLLLAGPPLPQGSPHPDWRDEALRLLGEQGYNGVVLLPTWRRSAADPHPSDAAERLRLWQDEALSHCDLILLWLPAEALADAATVAAAALLARPGKLLFGTTSSDAGLLRAAAARRIPVVGSLAELIALGCKLALPGALRRGGERTVPLSIWRSPAFQSWYRALHRAGHRLDGVEVEWTHRSRGVGRPPFLWAVRPRVQVHGERRQLSGEVVIGRADLSATVLYHQRPGRPAGETLVVLVREFRAAVRNRSGFAWMLPGGSAARASERHHDPRSTAAQEVAEETGLHLRPADLQPVPLGDRQLLASLASHHAQLFRAALSDSQLAALKQTAAAGKPQGATLSERCYVTLRSLRDLQDDPDLDWSQLGMILYALRDL